MIKYEELYHKWIKAKLQALSLDWLASYMPHFPWIKPGEASEACIVVGDKTRHLGFF